MNTLELVLRQSNGAVLVPLKKTAQILGVAPRTIYNQLNLGTCSLAPVKEKHCVYFRADDIARLIDLAQLPRRSHPTKIENRFVDGQS